MKSRDIPLNHTLTARESNRELDLLHDCSTVPYDLLVVRHHLAMSPSSAVIVRLATTADLPAIHGLIRASFDAMTEHSCLSLPYVLGTDFWRKAADGLIDKELREVEFAALYVTQGRNRFWVAVQPGGTATVVGCVGLKFSGVGGGSTAELVRMAVEPGLRGGGVGGVLMEVLVGYAKVQ